MTLLNFLKKLVPVNVKPIRQKQDVESLRADFSRRYHNFKLLLTANNRALELMFEIQEVLEGGQPLGMSFVLSRCTRVATNVFQIIKHLTELAPGKYDVLFERFKEVQKRIDVLIASPERPGDLPLVMSLSEINRSHQDIVGGKMANLGELRNKLALKTPRGFVLTTASYWRFKDHNHLTEEISELIQQSGESKGFKEFRQMSEDIQNLIIRCEIPDDLKSAMDDQYSALEQSDGKAVSVVMRSSALLEDTPDASFAGQYHTEFNVTRDNIGEAYKKVVASKYSIEAIAFRRGRGIRNDSISMCVGCLPLVDSISGGVVYTRNPLDSNDSNIIIHSLIGLPKPVADGSFPSDLFVVSRDRPFRILERKIAPKKLKYVFDTELGQSRVEKLGPEGLTASLSDNQVHEIASKALSIEQHYKAPQDIEWAMAKDRSIVFLQSRTFSQRQRQRPKVDKKAKIAEIPPILPRGGITASPGVAAGKVFVLKNENDISEFPGGSVLVVAQALPHWAVVLGRAAAVISEQGTVASHLANVARETHVPAIFGLEAATEKLTSRQLVTVDADRQLVYEGRIEEALQRSQPRSRALFETPVYQALTAASKDIVPLNLIDPDSPKFNPSECRTLHDITRYSHEKAVKEMFEFGIDHKFKERLSRQLVVDVPMQFWIIDLEDGFTSETRKPQYIYLDEIVSVPMLAVWRGMTTIPWQGPPPVDTKGFFGVLMQSAANPALNPSMPSAYADRNYFMISKNFCSLQSRFGYHFCSVEALVGERALENYVSFWFNGGAASVERRVRRTKMVTQVLEENGFRTHRRNDSVRARIEGYDREHMEERLEIIGYLLFHTRQLDMVMSSEKSIRHYKKKIISDIKRMRDTLGR